MRLLFEISNLRNATPATVSRGGVLFINGTDVGVRTYYENQVERSKHKQQKKEEYDNPFAPPEIDDLAKSVFLTLFPKFFGENTELSKMKRITSTVEMYYLRYYRCPLARPLACHQEDEGRRTTETHL